MNDQREWLHPHIDAMKNTLTLESWSDRKVKANFSFTRPAPDRVAFDGTLNGHKVQMGLRAVDLNSCSFSTVASIGCRRIRSIIESHGTAVQLRLTQGRFMRRSLQCRRH